MSSLCQVFVATFLVSVIPLKNFVSRGRSRSLSA